MQTLFLAEPPAPLAFQELLHPQLLRPRVLYLVELLAGVRGGWGG